LRLDCTGCAVRAYISEGKDHPLEAALKGNFMTRKKIYVGRRSVDGKREIFRLDEKPNYFPSHIHVKYTFTIGPFKTIRAANLCVDDDGCSSFSVAKTYERRVLINKSQSELIESYKKHLNNA